MYVCTECGRRAKQLFLKNSSTKQVSRCMSCNSKMDRYFELNNLMKAIDLLLLKRRVFRHYLFNSRKDFTPSALGMLAMKALAGPVINHHQALRRLLSKGYLDGPVLIPDVMSVSMDILKGLLETTLLLVLLFAVFHRHAGFARLSSALLLSSFYYLFIFIMVMWKYQWEEYFLVMDFLSTVSNSIVISEVCQVRNEVAFGAMYGCKLAAGLICKGILKPIRL